MVRDELEQILKKRAALINVLFLRFLRGNEECHHKPMFWTRIGTTCPEYKCRALPLHQTIRSEVITSGRILGMYVLDMEPVYECVL
jgi:hypothetical protein